MNAIILDGQLKSALSAVRSLGKSGIALSVGAERETGMALHSKYASARFVYPSPYTNQDGFIQAVKAEAIRIGDMPIVYAFSDATYLLLYAHRKDLCAYMTLIFPDPKSVEIAFDKAATYSLARVSGIPTIPTYMPVTNEEVIQLGLSLSYPAVVKTRRSVTWKNGIGVFGSAKFIQNGNELIDTFFNCKETLGEAPLVQELLLGEEYGVEMLARDGKVFALVTHHRIRSLSPTGGASVLKETLHAGDLKNMLETYAQKLVEKLAWSGPIMVEFKVDSDARTPYLMEINGRFWGSLPLSIISGVDMPLLFYKMAKGEPLPAEIITGQEGIVSNHFLGDVRHLLRVLFARDPMRKILYPSRVGAMRDFCILPMRTKGDVWSMSDPQPSIMEIIDILKRSWK
jgi:predicted ATP-grasp superfamily ATP-dependent carboligase